MCWFRVPSYEKVIKKKLDVIKLDPTISRIRLFMVVIPTPDLGRDAIGKSGACMVFFAASMIMDTESTDRAIYNLVKNAIIYSGLNVFYHGFSPTSTKE